MALAARIDDVLVHPDGSVEVKLTEGSAPLPATWPGTGQVYSSVQQFVEALQGAEVAVGPHLALLQLAKGYKADPTLKTVFLAAVKGKTITLDLTGLTAPIALG